jgi:NIMA (never in mitosis gene a)-related kinase
VTLTDFHILEELFRSAAGAVFKVRRKKNRQLCVLKERKFAELGRKRDILNEVDLLERLDHPNVIKCYGHFWDHSTGALYMVLEYADSGDLYTHVLQRRTTKEYFPEATIWSMFYQLCQGLNHMHSNGVIHRDIKSLNIMMCSNGQLKIGDLGVSRQVGQETMMLQTFYGTPLYASPELCENRPYNEKTDIWSLGVVLYERERERNARVRGGAAGGVLPIPFIPAPANLLRSRRYEIACLTPPFGGPNLIALANAIKDARYPSIPESSGFSESLRRMVAMLLQKK